MFYISLCAGISIKRLPYPYINCNFIIEDEAWTVIECDWTSVEGVIYMSLTESKVNYLYDDREADVADTDRYKFPVL